MLVAMDVDGVIRNSSRLHHAAYRAALRTAGLGGKFSRRFGVRDFWHLKGLGVFNDRRVSLAAIYSILKSGVPVDIKRVLARPDAEEYMKKVALDAERRAGPVPIEDMVRAYVDFFNSSGEAGLAKIYPESRRFVSRIHRSGIRLAIFTNSAPASVKRDIPYSMLRLFDDVITRADMADTPKPSGAGLRLLSERAGISIGNIVYIGDTVVDIRAARDAGCMSVIVLSGMGLEAQIKKEKPDRIFTGLKEARKWILEN